VISMIKEIEDGRRKITLGNFDNTVFNKF
jgi:hypothetical protein